MKKSTEGVNVGECRDSLVKKSGIYTKTGDAGKTALVGGRRVSKCDVRVEAYGATDELNAFIGLLLAEGLTEDERAFLLFVQNRLFSLGAYLATDPDGTYRSPGLTQEDVRRIEGEIDYVDHVLPPIRCFLLPGGCRTAALAQVCRTVCRRAEREIYRLHEEAEVEGNVLAFVNRLSDYFFVLSRKECQRNGAEEIKWE
ncbi:MAG: cob(I)yrinic acid a,c-diamide adenosyltransferase [Tannerellaceae bacterium]|jgi:cob(I)alamin adenosyltransferase|nr:cob(I)yrinic acid a,c-diamide adenosyltransferase [Tannerellaceae bacterium]